MEQLRRFPSLIFLRILLINGQVQISLAIKVPMAVFKSMIDHIVSVFLVALKVLALSTFIITFVTGSWTLGFATAFVLGAPFCV